jgi:uncharacterized protein DUF4230
MKYYISFIFIIIIFLVGLGFGYYWFSPEPFQKEVTSQVILESLQSRGFLVTETVLADQKVVIENKTGSIWKDFILGQKITASAIMKTSLGVDLDKLSEKDIVIKGKKAVITLPQVELQSVELSSDINLDNSQGIIKRIFDNDDGYNQALVQLRKDAESAAMSQDLQELAQENAQKEIERLIRFLSPEIKIEFK